MLTNHISSRPISSSFCNLWSTLKTKLLKGPMRQYILEFFQRYIFRSTEPPFLLTFKPMSHWIAEKGQEEDNGALAGSPGQQRKREVLWVTSAGIPELADEQHCSSLWESSWKKNTVPQCVSLFSPPLGKGVAIESRLHCVAKRRFTSTKFIERKAKRMLSLERGQLSLASEEIHVVQGNNVPCLVIARA